MSVKMLTPKKSTSTHKHMICYFGVYFLEQLHNISDCINSLQMHNIIEQMCRPL